MPSNSEKGLYHHFMWMFPKSIFGKFSALGEVDKTFTEGICIIEMSMQSQFEVPAVSPLAQ